MATLERHTSAQLQRAVTSCYLGVSEDNLCHLISPVIADELRISPDANVECVLTVRCRTYGRRACAARSARQRICPPRSGGLW